MREEGFYLGTHKAAWLRDVEVPLFVSARTLRGRATMPERPAGWRWALDSGGFTELATYGRWETTTDQYVEEVQRAAEEVGGLDWAAPQDWMVEPVMLERTGLTVREHQHRTVANFLDLQGRGPFIPVLQGWTVDDYLDHVGEYRDAGVELTRFDTVGVGSVCRRNSTAEAGTIFRELQALGLRLHGFGVKGSGLAVFADYLRSADSLAWSMHARNRAPLPGCTHRNCANCRAYARRWREWNLAPLAQGALFAA